MVGVANVRGAEACHAGIHNIEAVGAPYSVDWFIALVLVASGNGWEMRVLLPESVFESPLFDPLGFYTGPSVVIEI
jgi:hypothetical protein